MSNSSVSNPAKQAGQGSMPLIEFQLDQLSVKAKSEFAFGKRLALYFEGWVNGGYSSYFWTRNARWKTNRNYANGRVNMQQFMDLLEFNGKENYVNINWQCIHIVNRIISGLVGRWMIRSEKIQVTATDPLSTKQKEEEYQKFLFYIENKKMLEQLQKESGVQVLPQDDSLPADKEELNLWKAQGQALPEEILWETGTNDVLASCGWFDVLKEKMLHDSSETGFVGTYTWMDEEGVIHVDWLQPENCVYSYSKYSDFRDTTMRGYMTTYKISALRKKYGQEFHPNSPHALTEEQLFKMAQTAKEYQMYDNVSWNTEYNVVYLRPYDEWNVDILEFEVRTQDSEPYTVTTTKQNKSTILRKGVPEKKEDNQKVIEDSKINIYRGVYARTTQTMLEWGLKKNMIRPQDPKEIGNAEFSYSFHMVQNYDMMCMAVPEKIQEPADQMIIARLKIQQLVASMVPAGAAINWDAIQNIDYGLGEGNKAIDVVKMQQQTGKLYWRGRDAEGNPIPVPIIEMQNSGFIGQMQGLMELYNFHYQVLKDELGEDPNLITQAAQPRVAVQNIETSQQQAAFSTDYFYDAYKYCMEDTARKVSCLLKNSVMYGAKVYRDVVQPEEIKDRIFSTRVKLLPDFFEIQRFEAFMNQMIAASPELLSFLDPFRLMRTAKEDVKLAELLFRQAQKKLILFQRQSAMENQQQTIEGQIKSAQAAEQAKGENLEMELDMKAKQAEAQGLQDQKNTVLKGVFELAKIVATPVTSSEGQTATPGKVSPELEQLISLAIKNMAIPLAMENKNIVDAVTQPEQPVEQPNQEQPVAA
jgi:hypothetical protein